MASITFKNLQKVETVNNKRRYSDLHLDFANPVKRDITADYDETAIRNSLVNLFNTLPGQNLLNPLYGLNLLKYVFEPASDINAQRIGESILKGISTYEPRVSVTNINVVVNIDEQLYTVTLSIAIPQLNKNIQIPGILNREGYTLL